MLFNKGLNKDKKEKTTGDELFELSSSLEKNKLNLENLFKNCDDFVRRDFIIN